MSRALAHLKPFMSGRGGHDDLYLFCIYCKIQTPPPPLPPTHPSISYECSQC